MPQPITHGQRKARFVMALLALAFVVKPAISAEPATQPVAEFAEQSQAEIEAAYYPDRLDGTLSGKGDLEENNAAHSGFMRLPTALEDWFALKRKLQEEHGIAFSGSYGMLWQNYSTSLVDQHNSVGGKLALNLGYELLNRGRPDALWIEMVAEDRRPIGGDLAPQQAGLLSGSIIPPAPTWGDFELGITQFYVRQNLANNRVQYAVGKLFAPNFINPYPFFDVNRQYFNQSFSTSPTIASPLWGFGFVGAVYPVERSGFYVQPGMYTANSSDTGWTIDNFFSDHEYFYHVDVGFSALARSGVPIQARGVMDQNNYSLTGWYKDAQEDGLPEAYGVAFNANTLVRDDVMVFLRGGWSEGFFVDASLSAGAGWRPLTSWSDLLGFGVSWAHPAESSQRDQYTGELFYRFHVTPNLAITPDVQVILDPALDPNEDVLWVFGLRARVTF